MGGQIVGCSLTNSDGPPKSIGGLEACHVREDQNPKRTSPRQHTCTPSPPSRRRQLPYPRERSARVGHLLCRANPADDGRSRLSNSKNCPQVMRDQGPRATGPHTRGTSEWAQRVLRNMSGAGTFGIECLLVRYEVSSRPSAATRRARRAGPSSHACPPPCPSRVPCRGRPSRETASVIRDMSCHRAPRT